MIREKEGLNKKNVLGLFSILIIIGFIVLVLATTTNSPVTGGNYSGTMNFSCTTALPNAMNASLLYNASGGEATIYLTTITNSSAGQTVFENSSVIITSLDDAATYNMTCLVVNTSNSVDYSPAVSNITIDNTAPVVNFTGITNVINGGNYSGTIYINTSVSDATIGIDSVYFNITNSSGNQVNFTKALSSATPFYNITLNTSKFTDGKYNITVYANDSLTNLNNSERIQITIDNTAPVVTLTESSSSRNSLTLTISHSDATSGVLGECRVMDRKYATIDGTTLKEGGLACGNSYSYTVVCDDYSGNTGSVTASFSTDNCGGAGGAIVSGGTTITAPSTTTVSVIATATPTNPATITNFAGGSGVKEIKIEVNKAVNNVEVTVEDYNSTPSEVSTSKTRAYKYLHIDAPALEDELSKATMIIQVEKSWVADKGIIMDDVALFKYDENADEWDELPTTYNSEDSNYYYYTVELSSFSYFVIAPKQAVVSEEEEEQEVSSATEGEEQTGIPSVWVWIIIGLVVLVVIIGVSIALKKKK